MPKTSRPRTLFYDAMSSLLRLACVVLLALGLAARASAQDEEFNYDEAKVKAYTLPDPLVMHLIQILNQCRASYVAAVVQAVEIDLPYARRQEYPTGRKSRHKLPTGPLR